MRNGLIPHDKPWHVTLHGSKMQKKINQNSKFKNSNRLKIDHLSSGHSFVVDYVIFGTQNGAPRLEWPFFFAEGF